MALEARPSGIRGIDELLAQAPPAEPAEDKDRRQTDALAELRAGNEERQARYLELKARYEELGTRYQELDGAFRSIQLAGARAAETETALAELRARYEERQARFYELERRHEQLGARFEALGGEQARVRSDSRHTLFVPTPDGYTLLDRVGPAPEPGTEIELASGERFGVLRIGPSPFPGDADACAYLDRIGVAPADSSIRSL